MDDNVDLEIEALITVIQAQENDEIDYRIELELFELELKSNLTQLGLVPFGLDLSSITLSSKIVEEDVDRNQQKYNEMIETKSFEIDMDSFFEVYYEDLFDNSQAREFVLKAKEILETKMFIDELSDPMDLESIKLELAVYLQKSMDSGSSLDIDINKTITWHTLQQKMIGLPDILSTIDMYSSKYALMLSSIRTKFKDIDINNFVHFKAFLLARIDLEQSILESRGSHDDLVKYLSLVHSSAVSIEYDMHVNSYFKMSDINFFNIFVEKCEGKESVVNPYGLQSFEIVEDIKECLRLYERHLPVDWKKERE